MKTRDMDIYEQNALMDGSTKAGQYLDSIGETDLAKLEEGQFYEFFCRFMEGYEHTMRTSFEATKETF